MTPADADDCAEAPALRAGRAGSLCSTVGDLADPERPRDQGRIGVVVAVAQTTKAKHHVDDQPSGFFVSSRQK